MKKKRHDIGKNISVMAVVFLVASGSSIILQKTGVHEHITAIFIFAVFLTSLLTDGYIYGIVSALVGTLAVNYAYTYPFYGASTTLLESGENYTEEQKEKILKGIQEDSDWLMRMVENLLSITRIDEGRIKIIKTPTVLDELIDSVMLKFHKRYPKQEVHLELPEDIIIIPMDAIFIDRERLGNIFNGSYRLLEEKTPSADCKKHNSGIGLSVCQTIIKAHDGAITAENNPKGGAVFRFSLNREETTDSE